MCSFYYWIENFIILERKLEQIVTWESNFRKFVKGCIKPETLTGSRTFRSSHFGPAVSVLPFRYRHFDPVSVLVPSHFGPAPFRSRYRFRHLQFQYLQINIYNEICKEADVIIAYSFFIFKLDCVVIITKCTFSYLKRLPFFFFFWVFEI